MNINASSAVAGQPREPAAGYVDAVNLLEILFPQTECRPSLRWLREHQQELPHVKIGRLIFFDPPTVAAHLNAKQRKPRA